MAAAASSPAVLVIDDEPVVLDLFQRVLGEKGLVIRLARNAEEALALIEQEEFGCVLADKNLPGLDGIEIVRRVRKSQPYCACIVMTAYASTESAVEALRLGAIDYIEKPFDDLDRIADRIDDAVRQMQAQDQGRKAATPLRLVDDKEAANDPLEDAPDEPAPGPEPTTPIEMLQARVRHATSDLRRRSLHLLSRLVASKAAGREVLLSGEALLEELRRIRDSGFADREELRRIEEKLVEHLALARHAQSR